MRECAVDDAEAHEIRAQSIRSKRTYGSPKLGHVGPARQGDGFEASREMKSGLEIQTFATQKAAEDWIIQADVWGPLQ
jgi:hypothetical protein